MEFTEVIKNRYSCKDYEPKHNSRKELAETVRYIKKKLKTNPHGCFRYPFSAARRPAEVPCVRLSERRGRR